MKSHGKASGRAVDAKTEVGEGRGGGAELSASERAVGKPFPKGVSGNPGGVSKVKRAFLERITSDDADEVYEAFMDGVRAREWSVVIRAAEYVAGKPAAAKEDRDSLEKAGSRFTFDEVMRAIAAKGGHDAG